VLHINASKKYWYLKKLIKKHKGGHMKKTFLVSLILVCAFLIGNSGVALAGPVEVPCQVYLADVTVDPPEALPPGSWQECIEVCYDDGFAEAFTCSDDDGYGADELFFTLEDFGVDAKNLVGFSYNWPKECHAKLRGGRLRILEADCLLNYKGLGYEYFGRDLTRIHVKGKAVSSCFCAIR
jgi:hypothetical protein